MQRLIEFGDVKFTVSFKDSGVRKNDLKDIKIWQSQQEIYFGEPIDLNLKNLSFLSLL